VVAAPAAAAGGSTVTSGGSSTTTGGGTTSGGGGGGPMDPLTLCAITLVAGLAAYRRGVASRRPGVTQGL
jgi:hypothetical protein